MIRLNRHLCLTTALACSLPTLAHAQVVPAPGPPVIDTYVDGEIVVTARRRQESLQDVPVAISAVSGELIEARGLTSVRDIATSVPGLNINSDGSGRAFVAIRGVGVTLVQSVQPGVGLFVDGIYRPNTAYLNNPLLDVERVEVLRGPQGTLYGKNTLGGAINVITRQPGNELEVRGLASYAGPDNAWLVSGSVSTPIVTDLLAVRLAGSHREQDGFLTNVVIGGDQNYLNSDSINATVRLTAASDVTVALNGYHDWIDGTNTPYARVTGPRDYSRDIAFNDRNRTRYRYYGVNGRVDAGFAGIDTNATFMAAYDGRKSRAINTDGDFGPADIVRSSVRDQLDTITTEARFDTRWSDQFSSLLGLFYSREETDAANAVRIVPLGITNNSVAATRADTYAVFGTLFWRPDALWEVALGLRYDHEDRLATGGAVIGGAVQPIPPAAIKSNEVQPRLSVSRRWTPDFMTYATVARGYRGGGFNSPLAPVRTYQGDSAWSYELGSKYSSPDRRFSLAGAVFYNDYSDYIGLNSIAPSPAGGLVTVDLNTGDVESYGFEVEASARPTPQWTLSGAFTYVHARITDDSAYTAITGRVLSSDRLTFQPDYTFSLTSDYAIPIGLDTLTLTAGITGKGERLAATLNQTTPTFLDGYALVNVQAAYRTAGGLELAVFANNLFQEEYFESYIEQTTLALAGLPASDLGIVGDRRRIGARVRFSF